MDINDVIMLGHLRNTQLLVGLSELVDGFEPHDHILLAGQTVRHGDHAREYPGWSGGVYPGWCRQGGSTGGLYRARGNTLDIVIFWPQSPPNGLKKPLFSDMLRYGQ